MGITKDQWNDIEKELTGMFGQVSFRLGIDEVFVQRRRVSEDSMHLLVFINGTIEGGWYANSDETPACINLFWRQRSRARMGANHIKEIEKAYGKRKAKKKFPGLHDRQTWHEPNFPKAKKLIAQYKKVKDLELVRIGYEKQEAVA